MTAPTLFHDGKVSLYGGDCLEVLRTLPDNGVDSVVTDPPYHLTSIVKRFGGADAAACKDYEGGTGAYKRASRGFMGKQWDGGDIAFRVELWAEVWRVLKPGGHVVAFSGTRTYHRMACAIEDAGFEIRDQIAWLYGTGFPKSHDVSKAIDKLAGVDVPIRSPGAGSVNTYGDGLNVKSGSRIPHLPFAVRPSNGPVGVQHSSRLSSRYALPASHVLSRASPPTCLGTERAQSTSMRAGFQPIRLLTTLG